MGAGIEPGIAARHDFHMQAALLQVGLVDAGDFQLATGAGPDLLGNIDDLIVVEVQAGDSVAGLGLLRLFLDADSLAGSIELHHAVTLGIMHMVGKHRAAIGTGIGLLQQGDEVMAVIDVVAQHQRRRVVADEILADQKGLRQTIRAGLHGVLQVQAPLGTIAQQLLEARRVLRRGNDQNVADTRQHQRGERVVDHGLVIHRQQLLADGQCGRVQAGAGAARQDDALA